MKLILIRPPQLYVTVVIEITATDANTVLPEYSSLQNSQPIWNYVDEGEQMF